MTTFLARMPGSGADQTRSEGSATTSPLGPAGPRAALAPASPWVTVQASPIDLAKAP